MPIASNQPGCCVFTFVTEADPISGGGAAITGEGVLGGNLGLGAVRMRPDGADVLPGSVYLCRCGDDGAVAGTGMDAAAAVALAAAVVGL